VPGPLSDPRPGPRAGFLDGLFSLDGRVALVTGGSSGIGYAMARALALAGARVVLLARGEEGLRKAAAAIQSAGGTAAWVRADLADPAEAQRAAGEAASAYGEPDILVNAAGANPRPPLGEQTLEQWGGVMAVNLTAPFVLGQRFGPAMARRPSPGHRAINRIVRSRAHTARTASACGPRSLCVISNSTRCPSSRLR